jgi:antitoxin CptB
MSELESFKKKIIYRANYRGTKEMDILLSKFVDKYINKLSSQQLNDLYEFLNLEDEVIYNSYQNKMMPNTIKKNDIHEYFLNFKI